MKIAPLIPLLGVLLALYSDCSAQGEIGPHVKGGNVRYLGTFYDNHVYLRAFDSGEYTDNAKDGTYSVNTWTVSETFCNLYKDTATGMFAIQESSSRGDDDGDLRALRFGRAPKDSEVYKAWDVAEGAVQDSQIKRAGAQHKWVNVGGGENNGGLRQSFATVGVKPCPGTKVLKALVLFVETERHIISVDPRNKTFRSRKMDMMATPIGEWELHELTPGSIGEALLKLKP